jgi:cytochrome d ubiquinol oxidase subunit II
MTALYPLIIAMLLGLIFRGVAFEFRFRSPTSKQMWDFSFAAGSTLATLCQGVALGAFVQGIAVEGRSYSGGWFDWLTPFSLMTGLALVAGYALLGATWLILKTEGPLQQRMFALAQPLTYLVAGLIGAVSLWTPLMEPQIAARWFSWPNILLLSPVPLIVLACTIGLIAALRGRADWIAYPLALGLFTLSFIGLGISMFPYVVPRAVTIWQAAAPDESLSFLLAGAAVLIPIILAYTAHAYWVFRGKVDSDTAYH